MRDLKRFRFRFLDEADKAKCGDGWFIWDEAAIVRTPARDLVRLEMEIGVPMTAVFDGCRRDTAGGNLAATWLGVRAADPALAGRFDDWTPLVMLVDWELAPADEPEVAAPLDPTPAPDSQALPTAE
ncbi:hypothetical protein GCM10010168_85820 [Actinoplanes ianthinogenes]|uniref:Uncharacterized protein n=1 Tax=Actinoplanes ianthinogenes TaxID=122358 RepID=A0ABN6CJ02_9ACTN|nr:hypothetical protein [Actinoplanes ianthinogenes]BCJ45313.1 hypothetical protein Aiant_59700 [Actinoplanes ianthinogenes]GGR53724.1 hypothetical protein GCM10010168_85820 [Actinoplanes ianthinogenes]